MVSASRKRKGDMRMKSLRAAFTILALIIAPVTLYAQFASVPVNYYLTTTYTNASVNSTNVTGLAFTVNPGGSYNVTCYITWQANPGTATPKYFFTGPANFTALSSSLNTIAAISSPQTQVATTFASTLANTTAGLAGLNFMDIIKFSLIGNSLTSGTVQLQAAAFGAGTLTIQAGSNCSVQ